MAQATQSPSTSNPRPWPERDELSLLTAILEIAKEPAASYNPGINLYDGIAKILNKPFTNKEVLGKVKELRTRYEKKCCIIRSGNPVKRTAAFKMSEKVWGVEMQEGEDKPAKKKEANCERAAQSNKTLQEIEHGHKLEVESEGVAEPRSTTCNKETNLHTASKPELRRHEPSKGGDDVRPEKKRKRGMKQETDESACFKCRRPGHFARECTVEKRRGKKQETDESACFKCRRPGHFARECTVEKKIEKQSGEQQETKEISRDAAGLQVEAESKGEELSSTLVSASNNTSQEIEHGHKLEVESEGVTEPRSTTCNKETNPHTASKPELRRHEPSKGGDGVRPEKKRKRGEKQEMDESACFKCRRPGHFARECTVEKGRGKKQETDESACFKCRRPGHFARECTVDKKIEKQTGEQQETKEISRDAAGLQVETESKGEELSSTLVSASVQPGSHQLKPQMTQHKAIVPNSPHRDQKRVNVFQPSAYRPEQWNAVDRFLSNGHQLFPQYWNSGPAPPQNVPQPPAWGPRTPIPPTLYPPPPMPYRYPPPHPMNYSLPPNYPPMFNNVRPPPNFIPSTAQNSPQFAPQR